MLAARLGCVVGEKEKTLLNFNGLFNKITESGPGFILRSICYGEWIFGFCGRKPSMYYANLFFLSPFYQVIQIIEIICDRLVTAEFASVHRGGTGVL